MMMDILEFLKNHGGGMGPKKREFYELLATFTKPEKRRRPRPKIGGPLSIASPRLPRGGATT